MHATIPSSIIWYFKRFASIQRFFLEDEFPKVVADRDFTPQIMTILLDSLWDLVFIYLFVCLFILRQHLPM